MEIKASQIQGGIYLLPFFLLGTDGLVFGFLFWHVIISYK